MDLAGDARGSQPSSLPTDGVQGLPSAAGTGQFLSPVLAVAAPAPLCWEQEALAPGKLFKLNSKQ